MTPVFVDGAAGLALAAPALEGGLVLGEQPPGPQVTCTRRSYRMTYCHPWTRRRLKPGGLAVTRTHTSEWLLAFTSALFPPRPRASLVTANSLSFLVLISPLPLSLIPTSPGNNHRSISSRLIISSFAELASTRRRHKSQRQITSVGT
jgi:hypothetical protein